MKKLTVDQAPNGIYSEVDVFSRPLMKVFSQFDRNGFRKLTALTGILVIAMFGMIQAIHAHPEAGPADNAHCALCAVAHASPAVIAPIVCPTLVFVAVRLALLEPPLLNSVVLQPHYSRPPPPMA